jgi:integrase/recombinase XerD
MSNFPMIDFYCESCAIAESSIFHHTDVLQRVFRQMEEFGVKMHEESIDGLTGAAVQRWFNAYKKDKKPATVNNVVVTLNPFFRWAHTIYPDIPDMSNVLHTQRLPSYDQIPDEEKPKDKYYTDEEIARLLEIPKRDSDLKKRDRAVIAMFIGTGLRVSELCSLTVGGFRNYTHGYVRVRRKGGAIKDVDVADFVYDFVETYLKTRKGLKDTDPLFMTTHGEPCSGNQLYHCLKNRQRKVVGDGKAVGNHVLRHTFVSAVEKVGGSAVARDCANHKSLAITNRYDHSTAEQRHDAVNALRYGR